MARRRQHPPLRVYLNNRLVGHLTKEPSGAIDFAYDERWLDWEHALPVSLSLPLRETPYRGEPVAAVFENLLPDSDAIRRRVAEKVGARQQVKAQAFQASLAETLARTPQVVRNIEALRKLRADSPGAADVDGDAAVALGAVRSGDNRAVSDWQTCP